MPKEKVLFRLYAILYKKPTEACVPYPIAWYLLPEGTDIDVIMEDLPKTRDHPRYRAYWRKLGAPIKQVSCTLDDGSIATTPGQPIVYLREVAPTKVEKKAKAQSRTKELAQYFVSQCLKRAWTKADNRGMHMAHSKKILGLGYTVEQVTKCLERLRRGDLTDGVPWEDYTKYHNFKKPGWTTLLCVLWGEPPSIEREPSAIANLNMTPEEWATWKEQRKGEGLILDEEPEVTAARDFSKAPGWAKDK